MTNLITVTSEVQPDAYILLGDAVEAAYNEWRIAHQTGKMTDDAYLKAHEDLNNALYSNHNPLDQFIAIQDVIRTHGGK